jgi:hypothetical protein
LLTFFGAAKKDTVLHVKDYLAKARVGSKGLGPTGEVKYTKNKKRIKKIKNL